MKKILLLIILLAVFITFGWLAYQYSEKVDYSNNNFKVIPAEKFNLNDLKGYKVYLDFWASWCAPCRKSFPWMNEIQEKYLNSNLRIIAVNLDQKTEDMQKFLKEYPANFTIVTDPKYQLFSKYKITGVPTSILFNEHGKQIARHNGFLDDKKENYTKQINQLMNN